MRSLSWERTRTGIFSSIESLRRPRLISATCSWWEPRSLAPRPAEIWPHTYNERQNKIIKIETYLREAWGRLRFLKGTDREYIDQILDYTEYAEHDDAPDSAATVCRFFATWQWSGNR